MAFTLLESVFYAILFPYKMGYKLLLTVRIVLHVQCIITTFSLAFCYYYDPKQPRDNILWSISCCCIGWWCSLFGEIDWYYLRPPTRVMNVNFAFCNHCLMELCSIFFLVLSDYFILFLVLLFLYLLNINLISVCGLCLSFGNLLDATPLLFTVNKDYLQFKYLSCTDWLR